jgi:TPR repeat protein
MPLAHSVPLSEARYIWEAYQGEHGPDRFHTQGPFRDGADAMPYELQPSQWFWDAWPDRIVHGGECVPISKGTVDFYCALGKPAVWAGQPGHANLITFNYANGAWVGDVEQAFAGGPDVTYAQWYFSDDFKTSLRFRHLYFWAGAEYHLGLALGMNRSLQSYFDTRMAANIFKVMPAADQPMLGKKLLKNALEANPFNPALWYRLALLTPDVMSGRDLVQSMMKNAPDDSGYWRTVEECAAHFCIMDRPAPQTEEDLLRLCLFLQSIPGMKFEDVESYATKFYQNLADKNDAYGQLRMAERYLEGMGVQRDENQARQYFAKAIAQGNKDAARELELFNATVPSSQITVTASSQYSSGQDVHNLINGKGLLRGFHDNNGSAQTMWQSVSKPAPQPPAQGLAPSPAWVKFDFDVPENLASILVWNHNQAGLTDRGFKEADFWGSSDGVNWFHLTSSDTVVLPRASGNIGLAAITVPTTATHNPVKFVIIAARVVNGNYGSDCYGLSAVHFRTQSNLSGARSAQAN